MRSSMRRHRNTEGIKKTNRIQWLAEQAVTAKMSKKYPRCVLFIVRQRLHIDFFFFCTPPFLLSCFLTRGNQHAFTRQISNSLDHLQFHRSVSLYYWMCISERNAEGLEGTPWADGSCCSHFCLLCFSATYKNGTFCPEDLLFETVICPWWHWDTFISAIRQNGR